MLNLFFSVLIQVAFAFRAHNVHQRARILCTPMHTECTLCKPVCTNCNNCAVKCASHDGSPVHNWLQSATSILVHTGAPVCTAKSADVALQGKLNIHNREIFK